MKTPLLVTAACLLACGCNQKTKDHVAEMRLRDELDGAKIRISSLEKQIIKADEIQGKSAALIMTLQTENADLASNVRILEGKLSVVDSRVESARKLGHAEGRLESVLDDSSASSASRTYTSPNYGTAPIQATYTQEPEPPIYKLPSAYDVVAIIKQGAVNKWKDNYDMVEYEIEKQTEAYQALVPYNQKRLGSPTIRRVMDQAGEKWGTNFNMVLYEIEKQLEAKDRLDGRH